jgi:hypothetical protein
VSHTGTSTRTSTGRCRLGEPTHAKGRVSKRSISAPSLTTRKPKRRKTIWFAHVPRTKCDYLCLSSSLQNQKMYGSHDMFHLLPQPLLKASWNATHAVETNVTPRITTLNNKLICAARIMMQRRNELFPSWITLILEVCQKARSVRCRKAFFVSTPPSTK